jgi:hypothetical protein
MTIATVARTALGAVKHNSPAILTGFAVGGVISTAVLTARATISAVRRVDQTESEADKKLTKTEVFRLVWPLYIPPVLAGLATAGCAIGSQSVNARRQAALVGAFTISEGAFQEYRDQVVEALGETKERKVRDAVVQKKVDDNPPSTVMVIGAGNVLCLDTYTGRYFESTMEQIRAAENDFNEMLLNGEMYMSVNDFYTMLGLEQVVVGEQVGFTSENRLRIDYGHALTADGRPCLAISFNALPRQDYTSMFQ